jgi:hypothetical protein
MAPLFEALAAFQQSYPGLQAQFGTILASAYGSGSTGSPNQAENVIKAFLGLAQQVANAWPTHWADAAAARVRPTASGTGGDQFYLMAVAGSPETSVTVQLYGRNRAGGPPTHWPASIAFAGQHVWTIEKSSGSPLVPPSPETGGWYRLEHEFTGVTGSVPALLLSMIITISPLNVFNEQSAAFDAWIKRNADLGEASGQEVNPAFIYETQIVSFPTPAIPLIVRQTLQMIEPGSDTLAQVLALILQPLGGFSTQVAPIIDFECKYSFALVQGSGPASSPPLPGVMVSTPVLMVSAVPITGGGAALASALAAEIQAWHKRTQPDPAAARLDLAITLFGMVENQQLPLVQLMDIPIDVSTVSSGWWSSPT